MPLVLLPGYLLDRSLWRAVIERAGQRCIVPDLRPYSSVSAMAEGVLADLPTRFVLAGLSMGGYVALEMFRLASARIAGLALVNTKAERDGPEVRERRAALRALADAGQYREAAHRLVPLMLHPSRTGEGHPCRTVLERMYDVFDADIFIRHQQALDTRRDNTDVLSTVHCPALVIGSWQDGLIKACVPLAMAQVIPDARLLMIENCGHLSPIERPDVVASCMSSWLEEIRC
jgi:pimeloyl-ACP methyl ester carboxylesterase